MLKNIVEEINSKLDRILQIYHSTDLNDETMNAIYQRTKNLPEPDLSDEEKAYLDYLDEMEICEIKSAAFLDYKNGEVFIEFEQNKADKG